MKIKELIKVLNTLDKEKEVFVSSDEELNTIFNKFEIGDCEEYFVFYGLTGTEKEDF
jgi:hypothetical protein